MFALFFSDLGEERIETQEIGADACIGLGIQLVRETPPLVGRPYVENMAVMAKYNPFFERVGMTKIAESREDPSVWRPVEKLGEFGFRSYALSSEEANLNHLKELKPEELERVRNILLNVSIVIISG